MDGGKNVCQLSGIHEWLHSALIWGIVYIPCESVCLLVVTLTACVPPQAFFGMLVEVLKWLMTVFVGYVISEIWFPDIK